ncbi:MAG: response regulator [Chloroflexota bacterium]
MGEVTVLVASEYPRMRRLLKEIAGEEGVFAVGEAENAMQAIKLAKELRPRIALVDFRLPYRMGLPEVALSRTSGLEAGRMILAIEPQARVILVTKVDDEFYQEEVMDRRFTLCLARRTATETKPLTIRDLLAGAELPLVFVSLVPRGKVPLSERIAWVSVRGSAFGLLLIIAGFFLLFTGPLALAGVFLGLLGVFGLLGGIVGLLGCFFWAKLWRSAGRKARARPKLS